MTVIIVEGCDCSGKDTVIAELQRTTELKVVRGSSFEISSKGKDAMHDVMILNMQSGNVIFNRSHFSNLVYAPIYGYPMMTDEMYESLSDWINENDALVVYLHSDINTLKERMKHRGDDEVSPEDIKSILEGYKSVFMNKYTPKNLLCFDTNKVRPKNIVEEILKSIN